MRQLNLLWQTLRMKNFMRNFELSISPVEECSAPKIPKLWGKQFRLANEDAITMVEECENNS